MTFSTVIFDLDGTLLDTLADIADAANSVLAELGFEEHARDAYRQFVGEGVVVLFLKALPPDARSEQVAAQCAKRFQAHYDRHWNVHTRPYDGVKETLTSLKEGGIRQAVLSNKPDLFTKKCVSEYLAEFDFELVFGQRDHVPRKPDPAGALEILRHLDTPPERGLYVGDSAIDMETAVRAGMYPLGVSWGFRTRAELVQAGAAKVIDAPGELLEIVHAGPAPPKRPDDAPELAEEA